MSHVTDHMGIKYSKVVSQELYQAAHELWRSAGIWEELSWGGVIFNCRNVRGNVPVNSLRRNVRGVCYGGGLNFHGELSVMGVRIAMQDYKSLSPPVMISATLVNTQAHTDTDRFRPAIV